MRATSLVIATVGMVAVTGCSSPLEREDGDAVPAGIASQTESSSSAADPAAGSSAGTASGVRRVDWSNVTLTNVAFMNLGKVAFRNGEARIGNNRCAILPGGAKPAYGHLLTEEPANAPAEEDALVLVECGDDAMVQALIPVQAGETEYFANSAIVADRYRDGKRMTFTSYHAGEDGVVVAVVKKPDGTSETRRYRSDGAPNGPTWGRI